jgi:hypothetical protein
MLGKNLRNVILCLGIGSILIILGAIKAQAVPSFKRQTGMSCNTCHTVFPELTPFGRNFKLTGYTMSKHSKKPYEWPPPLSAGMQLSFTHINKSLPINVLDLDNRANDNVNVPQELGLYYAGRIVPHVGAFIQGTYDGVANKFLLDHGEIRPAVKTELGGKDLVLGATINNTPMVQDVLNTGAIWGFPWASPDVTLTPAASAVVNGGLDQQVGGFGAYFYWNNLIYGEATVYRTARSGFTQFMGAGTVTDTIVQNLAP